MLTAFDDCSFVRHFARLPLSMRNAEESKQLRDRLRRRPGSATGQRAARVQSPPLRPPSPLPRPASPPRPLSPSAVVRVGGGYELPENGHTPLFRAYVQSEELRLRAVLTLQARARGWRARCLARALRAGAAEDALREEAHSAQPDDDDCWSLQPQPAAAAEPRRVEPEEAGVPDEVAGESWRSARVSQPATAEDATAEDEEVASIALPALRAQGAGALSPAEAHCQHCQEEIACAAPLTDALPTHCTPLPPPLPARSRSPPVRVLSRRLTGGERRASVSEGSSEVSAEPPLEQSSWSREPLPPPSWLGVPSVLAAPPAAAPPPTSAPAPQPETAARDQRRAPGPPLGAEADALRWWESFAAAQRRRHTPLRTATGQGRGGLAVAAASQPFRVRVLQLSNLPLPPAAAALLASGGALLARLSVSLFDGARGEFFGATATSAAVPLTRMQAGPDGSGDLYQAALGHEFYLHTAAVDPRLRLVFELALRDARGGGAGAQHASGWASVPLQVGPSSACACALRQGTARSLLLGPPHAHAPRQPPLAHAALSYSVCCASQFAPLMGLLPCDFPICERDIVPGVRGVRGAAADPGDDGGGGMEEATRTPLHAPVVARTRHLALRDIRLSLHPSAIGASLALRVGAHNGRAFCAAPHIEWLTAAGGRGTLLHPINGPVLVECPQDALCALVWELLQLPFGGESSRPPALDAQVLAWGASLVFTHAHAHGGDEAEEGAPALAAGEHSVRLREARGRSLRDGVATGAPGGAGVQAHGCATLQFQLDDAQPVNAADTAQLPAEAVVAAAATPELSEEPSPPRARLARLSAAAAALRRSVLDAHEEQLQALAALHAEQLRAARASLDCGDRTLSSVATQQARQMDALACQLRARLATLNQSQHFEEEEEEPSTHAHRSDEEQMGDDAGGPAAASWHGLPPARPPSPPRIGRSASLRVRATQRSAAVLERTASDLGRIVNDLLSDADGQIGADDAVVPEPLPGRSVAEADTADMAPPGAASPRRSPSPIRADVALACDGDIPESPAAGGGDNLAAARERRRREIILATLRHGLAPLQEREVKRAGIVRRIFDVCLADGLLKKITHTNDAPEPRRWCLRSSHPELMTLSPEDAVTVHAGCEVAVAVTLAPAPLWATACSSPDGVADVLVFVNDEADNNEAVFRLRVKR